MKYIYPISLILLSSNQLCFSNTLSVGNTTYTVPEDWTTYSTPSAAGDSSYSMFFYLGTGYPYVADVPDEGYRYIPDTSGFENGSIQSSESKFAISNKLDTDMYRSISQINRWDRDNNQVYRNIIITPVSIELLAEGAYERIYNYTMDLDNRPFESGTIGILIDADSISFYKEIEVYPNANSLTSEETSTLYNISNSYTTSNPLTIIDTPTDSDLDGIPDTIETYLGNDPNDNSDAQASLDGIQSKYSLDEIVDLRAGSTMIEIQDGQATLSMEVEQSDDLGIWTNGGASTLQIPVDAEAGKKFFRFKMTE